MQDQKARIWDLQISRIIDILTSKPSPEESYRLCLLIANRRQNWNARTRETFGLVQALSRWVSEPGSTLLVVRAGPRAEARTKDLAANIINLLLTTPHKVIWFLSTRESLRLYSTTTDVLRSLVSQALRRNPNLSSLRQDQLNISHFQNDHTESEWLDLLCLILQGFPRLFMVVDTDILFQTFKDDKAGVTKFISLFQKIVDHVGSAGNQIKIVVIGYGASDTLLATLPGATKRIVTSVQQPPPTPAARWRLPVGRGRGLTTILGGALRPVLMGRVAPTQGSP
jgi:hypothetical protein